MRLSTIACVSLTLLTLCGCSTVREVPSPPEIVRIPVPQPLPAVCRSLQPVNLPAGSTAQDVIEAQHAALLRYEAQVRACAGE